MNYFFTDARLPGGELTSLRVIGGRIAAIGEAPTATDTVVDLRGDRLLPGLINAHDHLQLNGLPPLDWSPRYRHVREWISDVEQRRRADRLFADAAAVARDARLLAGGVKNLLSGVTTVAHHDPLYSCLSSPLYPIAVVSNYGWSHSLYLDGDDRVRDAYRATPREWPWIVHAAEGVTAEAAQEFDRLDALECLGANTLLVHGVALDGPRRRRLIEVGAGLIWCPSSNLRLFGATAEVRDLGAAAALALGTDSRLSGGRDLLDELRTAALTSGMSEETLEPLVTHAAARLLRLPDRGIFKVGARADAIIIPRNASLIRMRRAQVRLVLVAGEARYGDLDYARAMDMAGFAKVQVDGVPKFLGANIASQLAASPIQEPGLDLLDAAWRAA